MNDLSPVLSTADHDLSSASAQDTSTASAQRETWAYALADDSSIAVAGTDAGHQAYWLAQLGDAAAAVLELPADRPRPRQRSFVAGQLNHRLSAALTSRLQSLGASQGTTLAVTMLAAFGVHLHRLSRSEDFLIALAAYPLPLRIRPQPQQSFAQLLQQIRGTLLDARSHRDVDAAGVLAALPIARDDAYPSLASVAFDMRASDATLQPLAASDCSAAESFDWSMRAVHSGGELSIEFVYDRSLFDEAGMRLRLQEFETLLHGIAADAGIAQPLSQLPLLPQAEHRQLLHDFNATAVAMPAQGLHELIAAQCRRTPEGEAVRCDGQMLSYRELAQRSDALAHALAAEGVGPGSIVAVALERGCDMPMALLAIHKCGGAYLPLDPELPAERLRYMLDDARPTLVLSQTAVAARLPATSCKSLCLEQLALEDAAPFAALAGRPELPAYVIYTSGSTGRPKGVVVSQRNAVNCLLSIAEAPGMGPADVVVAVTTLSFDIAACDMFLPLIVGARLVIAPVETCGDGERLQALLAREHASFLQCTPSTWRLLLSSGWNGSEDLLGVSTGEPLPRDLAAQLLPRLKSLWNLYGPTETTIWSTRCRVDCADAPISIGTPLANTQCHVLDPEGQLCPIGVAGELFIGGDGVALGYHQRPELNAERFVPDPFRPDERLYRSGDLARWRPDGSLQCLGRIDFQVKLRGFRIEPGEIEAALNGHAAVADSVCGLRERTTGDPRLVAWLQLRPGCQASRGELRLHLRTLLAAYMVPQHFVVMDALPRLPNGKLDRSRLAKPFEPAVAAETAAVAPRNPAERRVAAIWQQLLGHGEIGVGDRFLDIGGHSLLAVQVAAALRRDFGVKLSLREVMSAPLSQIALACSAAQARAPAASLLAQGGLLAWLRRLAG